ncbi:MAG: DUF1343 domain-containing protein [Ignavibacteriae bacterium]|nr:DUF1343 domain-containing protein [Ignavibacteriota bacterium]
MKKNLNLFFIINFLTILILSCSTEIPQKEEVSIPGKNIKKDSVNHISEKVENEFLLGINVLKENNFEILQNKKVGLITNQTGVDKNLKSTIDILYEAKNVNLVALFSPEHGVRGNIEGGENIETIIDKKTKLPVYSLYGKTQKPTKKMLSGIDVLVYDIQDIGVRSYTFISTLGLAIEAASENNIEFLVLDRPNPLGGLKVEGNILESEYKSFISQYPIPYIYGLTCGELASLLVAEKMISTKSNYNVKVVKMENWKRSMTFSDTKLNWVPTSPHIPNFETTYFYPMTGILGELRNAISIGVGYTLPFQIIGAEWIDANLFSDKLNSLKIPGLYFRPISYKPFYGFGKGKNLNGVQIHITDFDSVNLVSTQFYIINVLQKLYPKKDLFQLSDVSEIKMFNKAIGTDKILKMIQKKSEMSEIFNFLNRDIKDFKKHSSKYYLYN